MYCTACGARLPGGARFCTACGAAVVPSPAAVSAPLTLSGGQTLAPPATLSGGRTLAAGRSTTAEPLAVWQGRELGGYRLERWHGSGPLGAVFEARREGDGPRLAVKLLRPWLANDAALIDEHLATLHLLNLLESPHLLPIIESFRRAGVYAIVMPWAEGGSLQSLLQQRGRLSEPQAVGLLTQAVRGLRAAAGSGLRHAQLKPTNLLFAIDGRLMLNDFGLAGASPSDALTAGMGSQAAYGCRAPEQWSGATGEQEHSDQYALGCLLVLMLTGAPPFPGPGRVQLLRQHCSEPAPSLRARCPEVSPGVEALATRLLAKEPTDRYEDLAALEAALCALPSWRAALAERLSFALPAPEVVAPRARAFPEAGEIWQRIPAGSFVRGSTPDEPGRWPGERPRRVALDRPFLLRAVPLSQQQWHELMGEPCPLGTVGAGDLPATGISWWRAIEACNRLSQGEGLPPFYQLEGRRVRVQGGVGYRLPSEDEWEYACRAGSRTPFWHGSELLAGQACFDARYPLPGQPQGERPRAPAPLRSFSPNPWGLFGMHGGVWDWCAERFGPHPLRVARGGSWGTPAAQCRAAFRGRFHPSCQLPTLGLRPARWETG